MSTSRVHPGIQSYLGRSEAAEFLGARGLPISRRTLEKMACCGGGPPYRTFGRRCLYEPESLLGWAISRLSPQRSTTSEANPLELSKRRLRGHGPA